MIVVVTISVIIVTVTVIVTIVIVVVVVLVVVVITGSLVIRVNRSKNSFAMGDFFLVAIFIFGWHEADFGWDCHTKQKHNHNHTAERIRGARSIEKRFSLESF